MYCHSQKEFATDTPNQEDTIEGERTDQNKLRSDNITRDKNTIGSISGQAVVAMGEGATINVSHYTV